MEIGGWDKGESISPSLSLCFWEHYSQCVLHEDKSTTIWLAKTNVIPEF